MASVSANASFTQSVADTSTSLAASASVITTGSPATPAGKPPLAPRLSPSARPQPAALPCSHPPPQLLPPPLVPHGHHHQARNVGGAPRPQTATRVVYVATDDPSKLPTSWMRERLAKLENAMAKLSLDSVAYTRLSGQRERLQAELSRRNDGGAGA